MHERELNNIGNNDAVVTIPPTAERQAERRSGFRSRVTREGAMSFEIEIPRDGPTYDIRCCFYVPRMIPLLFLLGGIVPSAYAMVNNDAIPAYALIITISSVFVILFGLWIDKVSAFTQTNVKITRDSYSLVRKNITWKSFLRILFIPDHFDDLENGNFIETVTKNSQYSCLPSLQAEVVTYEDENGVNKHIKLGSITFAFGLSHDEVEWLTDKINRFLLET